MKSGFSSVFLGFLKSFFVFVLMLVLKETLLPIRLLFPGRASAEV